LNEIYLTLTAGLLTLSGVIIGTLLEHLRERWKFHKEQEERERTAVEDRNKNFLSPLMFHLDELTFWPNLDLARDYEELSGCIETLNRNRKSLDMINELLKKNLQNLPLNLYLDILRLKGNLTIFYSVIDDFREKVSKIEIKNVGEQNVRNYAKTITDYQELVTSTSNKIACYCVFLMKSKNPEKISTKTIYNDEVEKKFSKLAVNIDKTFNQFLKSVE